MPHVDDEKLVREHVKQLTELEAGVVEHEKVFCDLIPRFNKLSRDVDAIKNMAIGALLFYLAQQFGVLSLIKKLIG